MEDQPIKFTRDIKKPHTEDYGRDWETSLFQLHPEDTFFMIKKTLKDVGVKYDKNTKFLELGSSRGRVVSYFKQRGLDIVGVDVRNPDKKNGSTILARVEQLPLPDNSFDVIFSYGLFDSDEYDQDKKLMLTEICRVLRKGGVYFVVNLSGHYGSFIDKELKGLPLKEVECSLGNAYKKVE